MFLFIIFDTDKLKIMKKLFYSFILIFPLLIISSCEKDEPDSNSNDNGCDEINCLQGEFVNCSCYCFDGYSGYDCSDVVTPTKMRITRVDLMNYDDSQIWDDGFLSNSAPDIYFKILRGNTTVFTSGYKYNPSGNTLTYTSDMPFDINFVETLHTIKLYDQDDLDDSDFLSSNDLIGTWTFTPWNGSSFPSTVTYNSSSLDFKFYVDYMW